MNDRIKAREAGREMTREAFINTRVNKVAALGHFYHDTEPKDRDKLTKKQEGEVINAKAREMLKATYDYAFGRGAQDAAQGLRRWERLFSYVRHAETNPCQSTAVLWEHVVRTVREIYALKVMDHIGEQGE